MIPTSTCYVPQHCSTDEKVVFTSAKFAEISKFLAYYRPKMIASTSNALICMPESLLREINQY